MIVLLLALVSQQISSMWQAKIDVSVLGVKWETEFLVNRQKKN